MPNYDDLKRKAKDALESFTDASVDAYKVAEEKTRVLARKTKLRAGIVNDKATVRRLSVELGTRYYKKYKDAVDSEFKQICEEITCAHERIAAKEEEIAELKRNAGTRPASASIPADDPEPEEIIEESTEESNEDQ